MGDSESFDPMILSDDKYLNPKTFRLGGRLAMKNIEKQRKTKKNKSTEAQGGAMEAEWFKIRGHTCTRLAAWSRDGSAITASKAGRLNPPLAMPGRRSVKDLEQTRHRSFDFRGRVCEFRVSDLGLPHPRAH